LRENNFTLYYQCELKGDHPFQCDETFNEEEKPFEKTKVIVTCQCLISSSISIFFPLAFYLHVELIWLLISNSMILAQEKLVITINLVFLVESCWCFLFLLSFFFYLLISNFFVLCRKFMLKVINILL